MEPLDHEFLLVCSSRTYQASWSPLSWVCGPWRFIFSSTLTSCLYCRPHSLFLLHGHVLVRCSACQKYPQSSLSLLTYCPLQDNKNTAVEWHPRELSKQSYYLHWGGGKAKPNQTKLFICSCSSLTELLLSEGMGQLPIQQRRWSNYRGKKIELKRWLTGCRGMSFGP